ncbi:DUF2809 domain-containing protein [uncultured Mucilaginibacter sp.]|uniref:ribosomal maturation YjgA family protein n=1 Tax=uncultured Mucilaginibacter sp. TaxID=797541 RepID=UPI0025E6D51D|nr:DUF2809 domain-containing protein [uncultured Mucilaginibacter sp.]
MHSIIKTRLKYAAAIIAVIVVGLLSRRIAFIPQYVGDALWALMIYLIARFIFVKAHIKPIAIYSLVFCFAIEFSQLYQAPWINQIRQTLPGRLILGQGFLWTDLLAYCAGVSLGLLVDKKK